MASKVSLLELCVRAALAAEEGGVPGVRGRLRATTAAGKVCSFVIEWAWMIQETGIEHPSVEDYVEWAHVGRRTGFYRLAEFRRLFGEWHDDPTPLARYVIRWSSAHGGSPRSARVPDVLSTVA